MRLLSLELSLTIALLLILASALVGMAIAFSFRVWALILISPPIAFLAAIVLHYCKFGLVAGVSITAACLAACQLAYLATICCLHARGISVDDEIDGEPGEQRERKIRRQHE